MKIHARMNVHCSECCHDMIKIMNYLELSLYADNQHLIPVPSESAFQELVKDPNIKEGIYYSTAIGYRSKEPITPKQMIDKGKGLKTVKVLIIGKCHHLIQKDDSSGTCDVFGTTNRPRCCANFQYGGTDCDYIRGENQLIPISKIYIES